MSLDKLFIKSREKSGMTLRYAAKNIGLSPSYLHDIEQGKATKLKMKYLNAAASVYNISIDDLCAASGRIPQDIYYKILHYPALVKLIRDYQE